MHFSFIYIYIYCGGIYISGSGYSRLEKGCSISCIINKCCMLQSREVVLLFHTYPSDLTLLGFVERGIVTCRSYSVTFHILGQFTRVFFFFLKYRRRHSGFANWSSWFHTHTCKRMGHGKIQPDMLTSPTRIWISSRKEGPLITGSYKYELALAIRRLFTKI